MLRAVVDTNLVVSGTATTNTIPYQLLEAWRENKYILVTSIPILTEIKEVLEREEIQDYFSITSDLVNQVIETLATRAFVTKGDMEIDVIKNDPDDNKFIAAALEGSTSHIIAGDKDLLNIGEYQGIRMVKAREFLENILR